MILFFEGKDYKRSVLDSVFGNEHARVISRGNLKDDKAVLDCVGYYYDPTQSTCSFFRKYSISVARDSAALT